MADDDGFDIKAFQQEIKNWANGASQEAHCSFASQGAARVLANIGGSLRPDDFIGFSFDVILIRAIVTSAVTGTVPTVGVKDAANSAYSAANSTRNSAARSAYSAASSAYSAANTAASPFAVSAAYASAAIHSAASSSTYSTYSAARATAELLNQSAPKALFDRPLWLNVTWPDATAKNWTTLRSEWSTDPAMTFWIDWYDGLLAGRTPDWDLWHDIVLIGMNIGRLVQRPWRVRLSASKPSCATNGPRSLKITSGL